MKGQVTIYIILGIVIVVALAGVFLLKDYILKSEFEREAEKFKIGEDFIPLYNSYRDCVNDITLNGIEVMASQGGYIDIPEYVYAVNPLIPFSNKLDVFGNGVLEVPYWFYETGNGIQTESIPALPEMQGSLSKYINENLYLCTLNLTGYSEYSINNFENFNTNVQITDTKVFVNILSNFNVDYKGVNQRFDDLKVTVDSPLGYLYEKSVELYNKQKSENYFEEKTIDYLVIYDDIPYSGESFSCSPRVWSKQNVEGDFKQIIEVNTDSIGKINDKYHEIDLGDNKLDTSFLYNKDWPFFMEINGGDEILKEESAFGENTQAANFLMALFCLNNYHFIYDIKYPVLALLNKDGLDFQFAFEVIIDNNQPKENIFGIESITADNQICDAKNTLISLYALNYETNEFLNNVDFKLSCVGTSCDIGRTSLNEFGDSILREYVPSCVNADIISYKENYHFGRLTLDTNEEVSSYVYMKPYHNLKLNIKINDYDRIRDPYNDEVVFVNFLDEEDGYNQFLTGDTVNLIVGDYIVRSYIMKETDNPISIEGDTVEHCTDVPRAGVLGALGFNEKKCFTNELEDVELDQLLIGGNEFEWSYDGTGNEITVYIDFNKIPSTVAELSEAYNNIINDREVRLPEVI